MRGSKLSMGVFKKQDFGVTRKMVNTLITGWERKWVQEAGKNKQRMEGVCLAKEVVI